ncbi:ComF family protein [Sulfurimonas aquatica]|uniref:ComF family protein n=1 Tax=Sulfurimonas aquatica TaxID=2672570 RepID=A0A975B1D2_9BACT|nr:phosphoribosyltransferase family protein [Sulfurimonas aquatica]QSZ42417.1 ComF family protein [Sulfurimonas aquatica]
MKCLMCESFSFTHICHSCQQLFLTPKIYKRRLSNNIEVISFYKYGDIKDLLHTKHTDLGFYIYATLAELSFKKFADEFHFNEPVVSIPIDDNITSGYSHTALINNSLKSQNIKPLFNKLRAKNSLSYSGKSREFRLLNPRDFVLNDFKEELVILVDDIVTTGATLSEAATKLKTQNKEILFCLTLCDVSKK